MTLVLSKMTLGVANGNLVVRTTFTVFHPSFHTPTKVLPPNKKSKRKKPRGSRGGRNRRRKIVTVINMFDRSARADTCRGIEPTDRGPEFPEPPAESSAPLPHVRSNLRRDPKISRKLKIMLCLVHKWERLFNQRYRWWSKCWHCFYNWDLDFGKRQREDWIHPMWTVRYSLADPADRLDTRSDVLFRRGCRSPSPSSKILNFNTALF